MEFMGHRRGHEDLHWGSRGKLLINTITMRLLVALFAVQRSFCCFV